MKQKSSFNWQQQQYQHQGYPQAYQHQQPSIDDISRQDFTIRKPQERLTIQTTPPPTRPLTYKSSKSSFQFENIINNNTNKSNTSGIISFPSDQSANIRPPTAPYEQGISQFSKQNTFQQTKKSNNLESTNTNYDSLSERSEFNNAIHQQVNETKQMPSRMMETLNAPKQDNSFKINFSFKTALDGYKIANRQQNCQSERDKQNTNAQQFKQHFSLMKQGQQQQVELQQQQQQQQQQFQQLQAQQLQQLPQQQQQQQQNYMKQQYKPSQQLSSEVAGLQIQQNQHLQRYSQPVSEPMQLMKTPQQHQQSQQSQSQLQTQQQQRNSHNNSQQQQSAYQQRGSSPYSEKLQHPQHSHQSSFSNCQYQYYQQSEPPLQTTQQNQMKLSFQQQVQSRQQQQGYNQPGNDGNKSINGVQNNQQKQGISKFGIGGNINPGSEQQFQQSIQNGTKQNNIPNSSTSSSLSGVTQAYQPSQPSANYYPKFSIQNPRTTASTSPFERITVRNKSINSSTNTTNTTTIITGSVTTPQNNINNNKSKDFSTLAICKPIINPANFQDSSFVSKSPTIPKRHMLDRPFAMPVDQTSTPTRLRDIIDNKIEMEIQRNSQNIHKQSDSQRQKEEDRQERSFPKPSEQEIRGQQGGFRYEQNKTDRDQNTNKLQGNDKSNNSQNKQQRSVSNLLGDARNQNQKNNSNNNTSTYNIHNQSKQEDTSSFNMNQDTNNNNNNISVKQQATLSSKSISLTDQDKTKNIMSTSKNEKNNSNIGNITNKPSFQAISSETITNIQQPHTRHERGVSSYYGNQPQTPNQQQRQKERNSSISVCQQQQQQMLKQQQNSDNKPQLHLRSNSKLAPKIIDDNPRTITDSILPKDHLNQENTSENFKDKKIVFRSEAPTLRFPQPSHYDRDSFKSKRSSVQSQTVRSEGASSIQQQLNSQQGNAQQNSFPSPNTYNMDTLSYQKISQVSTTSSNFLDSIKDISDNFIAKTTSFFNNNFTRNQPRLGCNCDSNLKENYTCSKAFAWLGKQYKKSELSSLKQKYENIKQTHVENMEKNEDQIEKDLKRTFPSIEMFQNPTYINQLRNLLRTVAKFDPTIGYVQGMNMIAASFLYHAEEYISFWLIQILFERLEMRDIFLPSLPGLSKHIQLIDILTLTRIPDLYQHLCQEHITYDMFCSPWIFSLFGVVLTPQKLTLLYSELLEEGWLMFYKLVLAFLCYHKDQLFQQDMSEILMTLTQDNYKFDQQEHWEQLIKYSKNVNLDANFINSMLNSYNPEKKQFVLKPQMF